MVQYKQLFSKLSKDGKNILVNLFQWADLTLPAEALAQFQSDSAEIKNFFTNLESSGELTVEAVNRSITTPQGTIVTIQIGNLYTWRNQRVNNAKYDYWQEQFAADPNVSYQPEVLQG